MLADDSGFPTNIHFPLDIGALQKEISALEELSRQLFMEYVDMLSVKVCSSYPVVKMESSSVLH